MATDGNEWWCFLLTLEGGVESISVTWVGIPPGDWIDELKDHFGDFVIFDPPIVLGGMNNGE
jgi:hypothetical protein